MNNYRIAKPSTMLDSIAKERIDITLEKCETDNNLTKAMMYQRMTEAYRRHWDYLGKQITENWTAVKGEPFIYEKHNNAMRSLDADMSVLFTEYEKLIPFVKDNFNYNSVSNLCIKNNIKDNISDIQNIKEPVTPTTSHTYKLIIKDDFTSKSRIDKANTTANIDTSAGVVTLPYNQNAYNVSKEAKATVLNHKLPVIKNYEATTESAFEYVDVKNIQGFKDLNTDVSEESIDGVITNAFPGNTHEGAYTYGATTDSNGNTTMSSVIDLATGQNINTSINAILDGNPDTVYEVEMCNVTPEALTEDIYGWCYSPPNENIRWAIGKKASENIKLAFKLTLPEEVPINQINLLLLANKTIPTVECIYVRTKSGRWQSVTKGTGANSASAVSSEEYDLATVEINKVKAMAKSKWYNEVKGWNTSNPGMAIGIVKSTNTTLNIPAYMTSGVVGNQNALLSILSTQSGASDYNSYTDVVKITGNNYVGLIAPGVEINPVSVESDGTTTDEEASLSLNQIYGTITSTGAVKYDATQLDVISYINNNDEKIIKFDKKNVYEVMVVLSQSQSYDCKIVHRYYQRVLQTRKTTTSTESGGVCPESNTTQDSKVITKSTRISGTNMPLSAVVSGLGGNANTSENAASAISGIASGIGSGLALAGIGGPIGGVLMGIGAIAGIFGSSTTTTTSEDIISDNVISGLELMDGWRYSIGVRDLNVLTNSYEAIAEIVSENFSVPFQIEEVSMSCNQKVPSGYPSGEYFKHYISLDNGISWKQISPSNYPSSSTAVPTKYKITDEENVSLNNTLYCKNARNIKYKCVITRPEEYPHNLYSPSLDNYNISVSGVIKWDEDAKQL